MNAKSSQPNESSIDSQRRFQPLDKTAWFLWAFITIAGTAADLWSKQAVFNWLGPPNSGKTYYVIPGFFRLVCCLNSGAAFGIFQGQRIYLIAFSVLTLLAVAAVFAMGKLQERIYQIAAGCLTAGILGNLYDRLFNDGQVRDFLDFYIGSYHWPAFNIADALLCTAGGLILVAGFTTGAFQKQNPPQKQAPANRSPGQ